MDWQPRGRKCLGLSRQKERCTAPGLTTVTTGAVTASLLHTAPSSVLGLLLGPSSAIDTNILQHGWRGKQLAAQQLFCPQSKASKSLPSPGSSKCSAPRVQHPASVVPVNAPAGRQAGNGKMPRAGKNSLEGFLSF